jgi:hypothetical protein
MGSLMQSLSFVYVVISSIRVPGLSCIVCARVWAEGGFLHRRRRSEFLSGVQ